jgi:hypothetical protein
MNHDRLCRSDSFINHHSPVESQGALDPLFPFSPSPTSPFPFPFFPSIRPSIARPANGRNSFLMGNFLDMRMRGLHGNPVRAPCTLR